MRESYLESRFRQLVTRAGGYTFKISPTTAGLPDRCVLYSGWVYFVELKTTEGRLDPIQVAIHSRFAAHGAIVFTLFGSDQIESWVARHLTPEVRSTPSPRAD